MCAVSGPECVLVRMNAACLASVAAAGSGCRVSTLAGVLGVGEGGGGLPDFVCWEPRKGHRVENIGVAVVAPGWWSVSPLGTHIGLPGEERGVGGARGRRTGSSWIGFFMWVFCMGAVFLPKTAVRKRWVWRAGRMWG